MAHVGLAALVTLIFGILAVAGEYRHGTITDTYLSFPAPRQGALRQAGRLRAGGSAAGLVSSLVAIAVTAAWWAAKGGTFHLSAAGTWSTLVGGVAATSPSPRSASASARCPQLGRCRCRRPGVGRLVEGIAGQLLGSGLARWLPFSRQRGAGSGQPYRDARLLPQWGGGLVLLGYAAAFAAAAVVTTLRRDVT